MTTQLVEATREAAAGSQTESAAAQTSPRSRARISHLLALGGILLGSTLLRVWGLHFGMPHPYHWDEKMYFHGAFYAVATGGGTESLAYGNIPYLLLPVLFAISLANGAFGAPDGLSRLVTLYMDDPTPFYLLGRYMWVGLQVLALWVCYRLGIEALSPRAALLGVAFAGVAFLGVSEGHFVKNDTTAMLGALLAAWAGLRLIERPAIRAYILAGGAVGLALAFKLLVFPLVAVPVVAHLLAWRGREIVRRAPLLAAAAGAALVALALGLPALLVDPAGTWQTFQVESQVTLGSVPTGGLPIWLFYWTHHLREGMGAPLELAGVGGLALWALSRDRRRLLLLSVPLLLWLGLAARPNSFARYALPIVPFLALAAGDLLDRALGVLRARLATRRVGPQAAGLGLALAAAMLALPSLVSSIRYDHYAGSPDTRNMAAAWIEANLPAGATVVQEGGLGFEATSMLGPPLRPHPSTEGATWVSRGLKPPHEFWRAPLLAWLDHYTPTYRITFAQSLARDKERVSTEAWGAPDAFVLISWRSDPEKGSPPSPLWRDLQESYALAARFDCAPCFPEDPYAWAVDFEVLAQVDPLSRQTVAGPRVWVYTRKSP